MMPMVFCASLPPWPSEYSAAEKSCSTRNRRSTAKGVERRLAQCTITTSSCASTKPSSGDSTMPSAVIAKPAVDDRGEARLGDAPRRSARRSARGCCSTECPGSTSRRSRRWRPISAPKITLPSTTPALTMPVPDRLRHVQPEYGERDEIEERRPDHRRLRPQHARRDDGRDRVGGVVQAVQEIEQQRDAIRPIRMGRPSAEASMASRRRCGVERSDVLGGDGLDRVGDVVALVDDVLDELVELLAVDVADRVDLAGAQLRAQVA